jgi:glycosyltransferase involved in cell wall biosynthesis
MTSTTPPQSVAVVIPVWDDYVRWLEEAVRSVVDQRVAEQVVVVDNASDVPVPELAGTTVVRSPRRLSTGAARNLGLREVRTELVVFLDADDVMLPGSLAALRDGLRAAPEASAFCMGLVDGDTGRRHRAPRGPARAVARVPRLFALANSVWSLLPTQGATIARTATVRAAGGYAGRSQGEDWALGVSLAWRGEVAFSDEPALLYRWRGDSPGQAAGRPPLAANARCVRRRLRQDPAVPTWAKAALPAIALAQWVVIGVVRPAFLIARRTVTRRG